MKFFGKRRKKRESKYVYDPEKGVLINKEARGEKLPQGAVLCCASPVIITKEVIQKTIQETKN